MAVFVATVKSEDLANVMKELDAFNGRARLNVEHALRNGTRRVANGARRRVSVRSGDLKNSITTTFSTVKLVGYAKAKQPYAHLVEFGAKSAVVRPKKKGINRLKIKRPDGMGYTYPKVAHIPARSPKPFMMPAFQAEESRIVSEVKKGIRDATPSK